jgi:hypothetical protein
MLIHFLQELLRDREARRITDNRVNSAIRTQRGGSKIEFVIPCCALRKIHPVSDFPRRKHAEAIETPTRFASEYLVAMAR